MAASYRVVSIKAPPDGVQIAVVDSLLEDTLGRGGDLGTLVVSTIKKDSSNGVVCIIPIAEADGTGDLNLLSRLGIGLSREGDVKVRATCELASFTSYRGFERETHLFSHLLGALSGGVSL